MLGPGNEMAAREALAVCPGSLQVGAGRGEERSGALPVQRVFSYSSISMIAVVHGSIRNYPHA